MFDIVSFGILDFVRPASQFNSMFVLLHAFLCSFSGSHEICGLNPKNCVSFEKWKELERPGQNHLVSTTGRRFRPLVQIPYRRDTYAPQVHAFIRDGKGFGPVVNIPYRRGSEAAGRSSRFD